MLVFRRDFLRHHSPFACHFQEDTWDEKKDNGRSWGSFFFWEKQKKRSDDFASTVADLNNAWDKIKHELWVEISHLDTETENNENINFHDHSSIFVKLCPKK